MDSTASAHHRRMMPFSTGHLRGMAGARKMDPVEREGSRNSTRNKPAARRMILNIILHVATAAALVAQPPVQMAASVGVDLLQGRPVPVLVSTDWLARRLSDTTVVVIHTASARGDYEAGHIPGARFLPWSAYTTGRDSLSIELPDDTAFAAALEALGIRNTSHIIISGGPLVNTARLYFTLDYFGLGHRTSLLDGGMEAWREEQRAISTAEPQVRRGSVTLTRSQARVVDAAWIVRNTSAPTSQVAIVDARAPEFFMGTSSGNQPRAGRLPMAANLPYTWTTGALTRYRDRMTLEKLFRRAGVAKGDTVVAYCHIGMQASVVYLAARVMGYQAALYDGSFEDWSRRKELPVGTGVPIPPRAIVKE